MKNLNTNVRDADSNTTKHRFPWKWRLSDLKDVEKNGKKVFSCFSCGGGSTMGYKLAGYTVVGNCEIDGDMETIYKQNHHPKHTYLMDIRYFNRLGTYPDELKNLDILDGSPPCSVFSDAGAREKGWGTEKTFREGQKKQRLDDLFLHFIRTAEILKPKIIIAENVKGLLTANQKSAFPLIMEEFKNSGYDVKHMVLNSANYGVPQKRERVIIVGFRKDLHIDFTFPDQVITDEDLFEPLKKVIDNTVDEKYYFSERAVEGMMKKREKMNKGRAQDIEKPCNTVGAHLAKVSLNSTDPVLMLENRYRRFTPREVARIQSFPEKFELVGSESAQYRALGNAIPPVMIWYVANTVKNFLTV